MPAIQRSLVARDDDSALTPTMERLVIVLLSLVVFALLCIGTLFFLRFLRRRREDAVDADPMKSRNHRCLSIQTGGRDSVFVIQEKQNLMATSTSPPQSPIPEIRITLPDELDQQGKRLSGRVVVVRVGDRPGSIGLEPLDDEKECLPPYQQTDAARYQSLDLERIGGLKEMGGEKRWS